MLTNILSDSHAGIEKVAETTDGVKTPTDGHSNVYDGFRTEGSNLPGIQLWD